MSSPRAGDMSAGFIGLAVSVLFLLATVTTIIALTNRAFAGHTTAAEQGHAAPAPAGQTPAPAAGQTSPAPGDTAAAAHAPGAH
ncbi:MAG TPA: hypothetical protein VJ802_12250 [Gemmatimonadaceae bacterium]|nr:hypothetical protein [Gemmatimonadaceae bacterium]